jgi:hypothetical protein
MSLSLVASDNFSLAFPQLFDNGKRFNPTKYWRNAYVLSVIYQIKFRATGSVSNQIKGSYKIII